jgi:hypothetical protein
MEERRNATKQKRQQDPRDRRAQKAHTKAELAKLREVIPQRVPLTHYPVPELGDVFKTLSDPATQLLKTLIKNSQRSAGARAPLARP